MLLFFGQVRSFFVMLRTSVAHGTYMMDVQLLMCREKTSGVCRSRGQRPRLILIESNAITSRCSLSWRVSGAPSIFTMDVKPARTQITKLS